MKQAVVASKSSKVSAPASKQAVFASKSSVGATKQGVASKSSSDARRAALNAKVYEADKDDSSGLKDANAKGQSAPTKKKRTNAHKKKTTKEVQAAAATRSRLVEAGIQPNTNVASYEMSTGETAEGECMLKSSTPSITAEKRRLDPMQVRTRVGSKGSLNLDQESNAWLPI